MKLEEISNIFNLIKGKTLSLFIPKVPEGCKRYISKANTYDFSTSRIKKDIPYAKIINGSLYLVRNIEPDENILGEITREGILYDSSQKIYRTFYDYYPLDINEKLNGKEIKLKK